ncbi:MAG: DNA polymerase III subunit gamma/tau [Ketobacter sp.]|nr:MAG: DNA polymerase III subunit gamma/tau [Ketobacter sp.]
MSYQVLARKWRPKSFREMVGQEHVLKALINALDHGRLHHAYLFTGTRGVGKTTIARILAKSLNCETGISSEPCGLCSACQEINDGRFVDLIEVDAASRTKVEDTRELLENVQYAPTRGRFKVYLIDEVHMLSGHSFNALLKTLEEPPPHVKFLLATTDPQKLPITILSRCLQFSLKAMTPERIVGHLKKVLEAELVEFEDPALWQLGRAADGSMRDALSLTDQAIAFGNGKVIEHDVRSMLGSIDREFVFTLIDGLAEHSAEMLMSTVIHMAEQSPDYAGVLAELISMLHRLAVAQLAPDAVDDSDGDRERVLEYAKRFAPEELQLYYQTGLLGRRDLPLAPEARSGFEMALLRMVLFKPQGLISAPGAHSGASGQGATPPGKPLSPVTAGQPGEIPARPSGNANDHLSKMKQVLGSAEPSPEVAKKGPTVTPVATKPRQPVPRKEDGVKNPDFRNAQAGAPPQPDTASQGADRSAPEGKASDNNKPQADPVAEPKPKIKTNVIRLGDEWADMTGLLELAGPVRNFARNCTLEERGEQRWVLAISPRFEALYKEENRELLEKAISENQGKPITLDILVQEPTKPTPDQLLAQYKQARKNEAIELMQADPFVQALQSSFGATLDVNSVKPLDD